MGWSTTLWCSIDFNKCTYDSLYKVEDAIEEEKRSIEYSKNRLQTLAVMTEPKKFCPDDEDPDLWLSNQVDDAIRNLEESKYELTKLEMLKDNWENIINKETGKIKKCPDEIKWDTAYLWGDYINTEEDE